jgi:hypothetical protein
MTTTTTTKTIRLGSYIRFEVAPEDRGQFPPLTTYAIDLGQGIVVRCDQGSDEGSYCKPAKRFLDELEYWEVGGMGTPPTGNADWKPCDIVIDDD